MSRYHPGGLGELAEILPQLLRSMDLSPLPIQNIVINRDVRGTITIYVPMYADVLCKIDVLNRGIKTVILWPDHKWITVWSSGLQIIRHPSKSRAEYIFPKDARLYSSETLWDFITGPMAVLKLDISSGKESKPQPTLRSPNCRAENCGIGPLPCFVGLCAPWIGSKAPDECEWC